jgi:hypothetical protein
VRKFVRRIIPPPYKAYARYKQFLRYEFEFTCAYCGVHEQDLRAVRAFHIDHFRPKSAFPELASAYDNLYYACVDCNLSKLDIWPDAGQRASGHLFIDPCAEPLIGKHAKLRNDGVLVPLTHEGTFTIWTLRLNRTTLVRLRVEQLGARRDLAKKLVGLSMRISSIQHRVKSMQLRGKRTLVRELKSLATDLERDATDLLSGWVETKKPNDAHDRLSIGG